MKDLVLHVGLPKSGSTTLQNGWFVPLEEDSYINYIGHAKYSDSTNNNYVNVAKYFRTNSFSVEDLHTDVEYSSSVTNIISSEAFTNPHINYKLNNDGKINKSNNGEGDPYTLSQNLCEQFDDIMDNVTIIIILRNQINTIHSFFTHQYTWSLGERFDTWDEYLNFILDKNKTVYDYGEIASEYVENFGEKNVELLFFEDFVNEKIIFAEEIANIVGIDPKEFLGSVELDAHYNRKVGQGESRFVRGPKFTKLHDMLTISNGPRKIKRSLESVIGKEQMAKVLDKLYYQKKKDFAEVDSEQKNRILKRYNDTNHKLHEEFGLEREKLERYSYLK